MKNEGEFSSGVLAGLLLHVPGLPLTLLTLLIVYGVVDGPHEGFGGLAPIYPFVKYIGFWQFVYIGPAMIFAVVRGRTNTFNGLCAAALALVVVHMAWWLAGFRVPPEF